MIKICKCMEIITLNKGIRKTFVIEVCVCAYVCARARADMCVFVCEFAAVRRFVLLQDGGTKNTALSVQYYAFLY